jgi:peptidylprolyl isomerase
MRNVKIIFAVLVIMAAVIVAGCNVAPGDRVVKYGDTVKLEYIGTLDNGETFDTSLGEEPLAFTLGEGEMVPAFETAILGMKVGEYKTFTIPAEEAYGPYYEDLVLEVPRSMIPSDVVPKVGVQLKQVQEDGTEIIATITRVTEETVTLDANHPLAGEDLTFEVELLDIS